MDIRKTFAALLAFFITGIAALAETQINVQAPNIVEVGEQFNLAFVIEGEKAPTSFEWECGDEFQLVWGPQKGTSTSVSIINGKTSRSSQTTYTYILVASKAGTFRIPSAKAVFKGETVNSTPISIEVLESSSSSRSTSGQSSSSSSEEDATRAASTGDIPSSDLYLKLSLSRTSVVVGEPVWATLKLYQRVSVAGFEDARFPEFNGFWSQEVYSPTNIEFERENVDGSIYNSAVLRKWVIIPQQAGEIALDPAELVCLVNIRTQSTSRSIFDSFFDDGYRTIRKRLASEKYTMKVSPLPSGAPASFNGAVGTFSIKAKMASDSLKAHEAGSVLLTITGNGNVSLLEAPKIKFPLDFESYDVKSTDNSDKSTGRTSGSKTFEYPFIPRSHGEFTIDPIEFTYYDVDKHKYVTLLTGPLPIKVSKGEELPQGTGGMAGGQMISPSSRHGVKNLDSDIRYIRTEAPSFETEGSGFLFGSTVFYFIMAALVLAALTVLLLMRRYISRRSDIVGTSRRKASGVARKRLATAGEFLKKDLYTAFYEALHKALLGYAGDKLGIDLADMSKDNISATLVSSGVSEALAGEFIELLDACEYARYAPDSGNEAMNAHYEKALSVISGIDSSMKSSKSFSKAAHIVACVIATGLISSSLVPSSLHAALPEDMWNEGVEAYASGNWEEAVSSFGSIAALGIESLDLYYNLAGAYFKAGENAKAILYYNKALKLDPSDEDVRANLALAESLCTDSIDSVPEFFLVSWTRKVCRSLSSNTWAIISIVLLSLLLFFVLVFLLSSTVGLRKTSFFLGILFLLLFIGTFCFSSASKKDAESCDSAIVMVPVVSSQSAPSETSSKALFVLHEGTKVTILDTVGDYYRIEISDGRQGWLPVSSVEII